MSEGYNNKISKEGEEFILSLNMYLVSTGKSEAEIKEFIEEAEQHLILGEQEGKSLKDILVILLKNMQNLWQMNYHLAKGFN